MGEIDNAINILKDINPTNRDPIYNSFIYWAQKPYNITSKLIEILTKPGDIVLDPFMGSAVSLFEAIRLSPKRRVIGNDLNEYPVFIVNSLLKSYNIDNLNKLFYQFINKIKNDLDHIYYTRCIQCNQLKIADSFLFDVVEGNKELKEVKYVCKDCYGGNKKPIKKPDKLDVKLFNQKYKISKYYFKNITLLENARIAVGKNKKISDLFTDRGLYVINYILEEMENIRDKDFKLFLKLTLSSLLHLAKITDRRSNSQWLLWYPKTNCLEKNVVNLFEKRGKLVLNTINAIKNEGLDNVYKADNFNELNNVNSGYLLLSSPAQMLIKKLPSNSVDLIVTDPPYLDQIPYSEYMQLYYAFTSSKFNLEDEIIVSDSIERDKNKEDYFNLLDKAFHNMYSILKDNKYLCIYFHDNDIYNWYELINIASKNRFKYINQMHIYKKKKTVKNITNPKKSLHGDSIIFFQKRSNTYYLNTNTQDKYSFQEIKNMVKTKSEEIIRKCNGATTSQLYDSGLLKMLIENNLLKTLFHNKLDLLDILEEFFIFKNGKWHINDNND